jgi:hypothetical protein
MRASYSKHGFTVCADVSGDESMGYKVRKSVKLGPVRVTMSKSGVSYSAGVKGARLRRQAEGKVQASLSAPKTGLRYTTTAWPSTARSQTAQSRMGSRTPPRAPARRRRSTERRRSRLVVAAAILVAGVVAGFTLVARGDNRPRLPASLKEDLQLSGMVNGRLMTATAVQGMTTSFPGGPSGQGSGFGPTDATACVQNTGEGWELDLYGRVGANEMSLSFDGDDPGANDMADGYVGVHDIDNNASSGGLVAFYWGSDSLNYPIVGSATLVVNKDSDSGTMSVDLTDAPGNFTKLEKITGSWRCA